jgi:hypothetical protein
MRPPPDIAAPHAFDPVAERAERQMRVMAQLSEIGLGLARKLVDEIGGSPSVAMLSKAALMYTRIARTVRQCIALEAKIDEALREWLGLSEAERAERRASVGAKAVDAEVRADAEIVDAAEVEQVSERGFEAERGERGERAERFWADSYVIEDEGSFVDIVTKVCRDLGVTPDWSGWSEDGPEDLVVKADGGGFWRVSDPDRASERRPDRRHPPQRGPPS